MAARGPVPKRSDQRRRVNKPATPVKSAPKGAAMAAAHPPAAEEWHPAARRWYDSLATSGQSVWYTDADWATAWIAAESLSRELNPRPYKMGDSYEMVMQPMTSATLAAFLKACTALLVTEGDRRRLTIELDDSKPRVGDGEAAASVSEIDEFRRRSEARSRG